MYSPLQATSLRDPLPPRVLSRYTLRCAASYAPDMSLLGHRRSCLFDDARAQEEVREHRPCVWEFPARDVHHLRLERVGAFQGIPVFDHAEHFSASHVVVSALRLVEHTRIGPGIRERRAHLDVNSLKSSWRDVSSVSCTSRLSSARFFRSSSLSYPHVSVVGGWSRNGRTLSAIRYTDLHETGVGLFGLAARHSLMKAARFSAPLLFRGANVITPE